MGALVLYVIYQNPSDYPGQFVVRRWEVGPKRTTPIDPPIVITTDLGVARYAIPRGLHCMGRDRDDETHIIEVWL